MVLPNDFDENAFNEQWRNVNNESKGKHRIGDKKIRLLIFDCHIN